MPLSSLKSSEKVIIPRNFILLGELEEVEKSQTHLGNISYGLDGYDDNMMLERWQGIILSMKYDDLAYPLKIYVGKNYPEQPPEFTFCDPKPSLPFIDKDGKLLPSFPLFCNWTSDKRIKDVLLSLKQYLK